MQWAREEAVPLHCDPAGFSSVARVSAAPPEESQDVPTTIPRLTKKISGDFWFNRLLISHTLRKTVSYARLMASAIPAPDIALSALFADSQLSKLFDLGRDLFFDLFRPHLFALNSRYLSSWRVPSILSAG